MKVTLLASFSGSRNGVDWPAAGSVVDLPDSEAADLIRNGQAVEVVSSPKAQTAKTVAPESAQIDTRPARKG